MSPKGDIYKWENESYLESSSESGINYYFSCAAMLLGGLAVVIEEGLEKIFKKNPKKLK